LHDGGIRQEGPGVKRADIFASDETRRQIDFRDLRYTGLTWRAIRGDDSLRG